MIITGKGMAEHTYDAIVVGSGISGGWAAKELCERGLKTLLLERGRDIEHIKDYQTAALNPWDFTHRLYKTNADALKNPVQSTGYDESNRQFFVNDEEHPYLQEKPFLWKRGYQVGGRSLTWGRQCYRLSDLDFEANAKEGIAIDWPIRYRDIAPWYDHVERFIGVSGRKENIGHLPDGEFIEPMELNCIEKHLAAKIRKQFDNRVLTIARVANLTRPLNGRDACQNRNLCSRGCPFGGYFSTNSSTLPAAIATGNLTLRPYCVVVRVLYDHTRRIATGVQIIDALTKKTTEYHSKIIFLNASTINTASILLNSASSDFPNGLGNSSGQVGHNLMDHHSSAGAAGTHSGFKDQYYKGRRPCGFYIPRYTNITNQRNDYLRSYGIQGKGERKDWWEQSQITAGFGADFKQQITRPGDWTVWMAGWGECLPYYENQVSLDESKKDQWGLPLVNISFEFKENEKSMMRDIRDSSAEMLEKAGFTGVNSFNYDHPGGATVHEMGTARMGTDGRTSVLNKFNQMHDVKNIFITDGSCMTSSACQNPSLTYMALTARACQYAVEQLKTGQIA